MSTNLLAIVAGTLAPALLFVPAIIQSSRERERAERRREDESRARDAAREKAKEGEAVRRIVYKAYKGMLDQHAHGLEMLTAIIHRVGIGCPPEIARFALEQTRERLSRFDCKPINKALDELKSFEV